MTSKIHIEDLKIYAYHGVLPEENTIGTYYILNLEVETDIWKSTQTDHLEDTLSYADINDIIHYEMSIPSQLLEHVAGRIINAIHQQFPDVKAIKIKIIKTNPPMKGEMKGAGVEFEKRF